MAKNNENVVQDFAGPVKDAKGRFVKGHSGNPSGVSKEKKSIIDLCKSMSEDVVYVLYDIAMNDEESGSTRILAGNSILDRGFGKPGIRKQEGEQEQFIPQQMIINMSKEDYEEYLKEQQEMEDAVQQTQ